MAAPLRERLFSLELLVDWVRLEAGVLPSSVAEEKEASLPLPPPPGFRPAVAFRLLDFPTLLVYPPGASDPQPRPGVVTFGRGKSCLFRLHPPTLHRLLRETPLYVLLLQLAPGRPTPTPRLLGSCGVSLADAAQKVLGPVQSACTWGHRECYPLCNQVGKRIGDIALGYRLTDLGKSLLGRLEGQVTCRRSELELVEGQEAGEVNSLPEKQRLRQPTSGPISEDDAHLVDLKITTTQELKEIDIHGGASSDNTDSGEKGKTSSSRCNSPNQEELDIEANTFCPPPLYYTHLIEKKMPSAQGKITFVPQVNVPEELDAIFQEENHVNPQTHTNFPKYVNTITKESLSLLTNPSENIQNVGKKNQTPCHSQTEQNRITTIRELPLLNALLVELSLLYAQPMASPTHIHPHLAWLYRTEEKNEPDSLAKATCKSEPKKERLSVGEKKKSVSLQNRKNQVENLRESIHYEKPSSIQQNRVPRGRLLYGITNTLKLRLKQTNPDMLLVHEKREQERKMQAQILGAKLRIPSSKVKVLSFVEQRQKSHQLPEDQCLVSDATFAENSHTSRQVSRVLDEPRTTKTKLCTMGKKTIYCTKNRTNSGSLEEKSAVKSIVSEQFNLKNIFEDKVETEVQSSCDVQQNAIERIVDKEIGSRQVKTTNNAITDVSENKLSKSSSSESISELEYSDDFTSPCYSEASCAPEDTGRSIQAHESPDHCQSLSKSSDASSSIRKHSSEKSSIFSPPFSTGLPIHSYKRSNISKPKDKGSDEASYSSTSDLSSSHWTEEKETQRDHNSMPNSKLIKSVQDSSRKLKTKAGCKSLEKSQSPRTSQVSSYLPSNLSELEFKALDVSSSDQFEEDSDEVGSLNISKQCKDISELVINKLPGYTV
ncbi:microtubule-associated protein 10 [Echinops telfairi]|uniref:Microtubule-associated protein 10 n=1 Tax=Echinops telfairi TaxID=9371 RepID=A0ABM0J0P3_ECHTE|nr:microtubule-associated protein 10 [Echinops telfairi]